MTRSHNRFQTLPELSSVDFDNIDQINDYAARLIAIGDSLGVINSPVRLQSKEAAAIYRIAAEWVTTVKSRLMTMALSDAIMIVDSYEIMFRIANRTSATPAETNSVKLACFEAMISGDKTVDEYILFRLIRRAIRQREKAFLGRPLSWTCLKESQWHKEAKAGFEQTNLHDYDIINRVSILLESDLLAFEGNRQQQFKKHLFDRYRHFLEKATPNDRRLTPAAMDFLLASARFLSDNEFDRYYKSLNRHNKSLIQNAS